MKRILIVSLHFGPGHVAHLKAWLKMCYECGYDAKLLINDQYTKFFQKSEFEYFTEIKRANEFQPEIAIVYNFGIENIHFFRWCEKNRCKIVYVLHEPYMGLKELLKDGTYCVKQGISSLTNNWLCGHANKVIVCSKYAENNCKRFMKKVSKKITRFPLIFLDEYIENTDVRKYFSLIGTYASSKGSDLFLNFVKQAFIENYDIDFQIATRVDISNLLKDDIIQSMIKSNRLIVKQGKVLTTEEINNAYKCSVCCWNGYRRSTQSGVLPNAFMQGTPVLASRLGSFEEFVVPGITGEFIDNKNMKSVYEKYLVIKKNDRQMSDSCRQFFLENFFYKSQIERFSHIIDSL